MQSPDVLIFQLQKITTAETQGAQIEYRWLKRHLSAASALTKDRAWTFAWLGSPGCHRRLTCHEQSGPER